MAANGALIDPEKDIYAIPSRASSQKREIYFLALVDILTQYGMLFCIESNFSLFLQNFRLQAKLLSITR